jgi:hypothetical protein
MERDRGLDGTTIMMMMNVFGLGMTKVRLSSRRSRVLIASIPDHRKVLRLFILDQSTQSRVFYWETLVSHALANTLPTFLHQSMMWESTCG